MINNYVSILIKININFIKINCMFVIVIVFRKNNFYEFYNLN